MKINFIFYSKLIFFIFFLLSYSIQANQPDSDCIKWFKASKLSFGKTCESKCVNLVTDMATYMCPNQCSKLCENKIDKKILAKIIYYPGLTPSERRVIEKYPEEAITVFIQKTRAEFSSNSYFPDQGLNDEADVFRHFIWSGLLTKMLGADKAKEFLNAHEENPLQHELEKEMDLFNNDKGISTTLKLILDKKWSLENLEKSGLELLKLKNLKVLKPGLKIPEIPK